MVGVADTLLVECPITAKPTATTTSATTTPITTKRPRWEGADVDRERLWEWAPDIRGST